MFITDRKLKEMISGILNEVAYSEPFAGNLAYFVVNFLAADRLKKYISPRMISKTPLNPMTGIETHKIDLNKTFQEQTRRNKPAFLPLTARELNFSQGAKSAIHMFYNHHQNLKNSFEFIKNKLNTDKNFGSQFSRRSAKKQIDQWSGIIWINIQPGFNGNSLEGASFNTADKSLNLTFQLETDFMTFGLTAGQELAYESYENLMREAKNGLVHELVHSRQSETGFQKPPLNLGENEIQRHFRINYFGYSDIDKTIFPKIAELQDYLKKEIVDFYDRIVATSGLNIAYSGFEDLRNGINTSISPDKLYAKYFYSKILAQLFSPEEVEAYVRGYRSEAKSDQHNAGLTKKTAGPDYFYQEVEAKIRKKMEDRFEEFVAQGLQDLNLNQERYAPFHTPDDYKKDMVEGYMKVYKSIFD